MYVCLCKGINDRKIRNELAKHGPNPQSLIRALEFDRDCCGKCAENIQNLIQDAIAVPAQ